MEDETIKKAVEKSAKKVKGEKRLGEVQEQTGRQGAKKGLARGPAATKKLQKRREQSERNGAGAWVKNLITRG